MPRPPVKYAFTHFNVDHEPEFDKHVHQFLIFGFEICPDTGRPHWQGYVEFIRSEMPESIADKWKSMGLDSKGHIEPARADAAKNIAYCSKAGIVTRFGEPTARGQRSDLTLINLSIIERKRTVSDIALDPDTTATWARNYRALGLLETMVKKDDERPECKITFITGPPGTGKSTYVKKKYPKAYWKDIAHKWFTYYEGQDVVVFDEFRQSSFNNIPIPTILAICSSVPYNVQVHCNLVQFRASKLVIISNYSLDELIGSYDAVTQAAFRRRVAEVINIVSPPKSRPQDVKTYKLDLDQVDPQPECTDPITKTSSPPPMPIFYPPISKVKDTSEIFHIE